MNEVPEAWREPNEVSLSNTWTEIQVFSDLLKNRIQRLASIDLPEAEVLCEQLAEVEAVLEEVPSLGETWED